MCCSNTVSITSALFTLCLPFHPKVLDGQETKPRDDVYKFHRGRGVQFIRARDALPVVKPTDDVAALVQPYFKPYLGTVFLTSA